MIKADRPASNESELLGRSFNGSDDGLDLNRKPVEDGSHFAALDKFDLVERYKKGILDVHFTFTVCDGNFSQYDLVFHAIPSGRVRETGLSTGIAYFKF